MVKNGDKRYTHMLIPRYIHGMYKAIGAVKRETLPQTMMRLAKAEFDLIAEEIKREYVPNEEIKS